MSRLIFAEPGSNFQQVGGNCPAGWVVMEGERPSPDYVASADGTWVVFELTEQEMKDAEIAQDKQYLAETDWVIAKISEASFTGQDVAPLLEQYASQITGRENARVRIRINEGRI